MWKWFEKPVALFASLADDFVCEEVNFFGLNEEISEVNSLEIESLIVLMDVYIHVWFLLFILQDGF